MFWYFLTFLLESRESTRSPMVKIMQTELNSSLGIKITQCPSRTKSLKTAVLSHTSWMQSFHPNKVTQYFHREEKVLHRLLYETLCRSLTASIQVKIKRFCVAFKKKKLNYSCIFKQFPRGSVLHALYRRHDGEKMETSGTFVFLPTSAHLPTCITNRSRKKREVKWWRIKKKREGEGEKWAKQIPSVQNLHEFCHRLWRRCPSQLHKKRSNFQKVLLTLRKCHKNVFSFYLCGVVRRLGIYNQEENNV